MDELFANCVDQGQGSVHSRFVCFKYFMVYSVVVFCEGLLFKKRKKQKIVNGLRF